MNSFLKITDKSSVSHLMGHPFLVERQQIIEDFFLYNFDVWEIIREYKKAYEIRDDKIEFFKLIKRPPVFGRWWNFFKEDTNLGSNIVYLEDHLFREIRSCLLNKKFHYTKVHNNNIISSFSKLTKMKLIEIINTYYDDNSCGYGNDRFEYYNYSVDELMKEGRTAIINCVVKLILIKIKYSLNRSPDWRKLFFNYDKNGVIIDKYALMNKYEFDDLARKICFVLIEKDGFQFNINDLAYRFKNIEKWPQRFIENKDLYHLYLGDVEENNDSNRYEDVRRREKLPIDLLRFDPA